MDEDEGTSGGTSASHGDDVGGWIGPYRLLHEVGHGGMGVVYAAERRGDVSMTVAVKVIRQGMDTQEVLARFEQERQALALMDHEHIARIFDAGVTASGQPFFAMEYVAGARLLEYCDGHRLGVEVRLDLFRQLCAAVQHAHSKGVIHRDLKPGNVLVKEDGDRRIVKVIDFGLARAVNGPLTRRTLWTVPGRTLGTLEYMSPEQASNEHGDIDTRTDVYSLGAILYELLVGQLPFDRQQWDSAGDLERRLIVRERDRLAPATRLHEDNVNCEYVADVRSTSLDRLRRLLRRDLGWITMRAMHMDRQRRYPTAQSLAEDIERYLRHEPVLAAPDSALYRLSRFCRRRRRALTMGIALLLAAGFGAVQWVQRLQGALAAELDRALQADRLRLDALVAESEACPRALPSDRPRLRDWLLRADRLLVGEAAHRQRLAGLDPAGDEAAGERRYLEDLAQFGGDAGTRTQVIGWLHAIDAVEVAASNAAAAWREAADFAEKSGKYALDGLPPQEGFVPLGPDPDSGLLEFAYVPTGTAPDRDAASALQRQPDGALVFVLLPGGSVTIGAGTDDPLAQRAELPPHEVEIEPFLLAKFEVTWVQWEELTGGSPSGITIETWHDRTAAAHAGDKAWLTRTLDGMAFVPVEQVSWVEAEQLLVRLHLRLPTETEWEYACRCGAPGKWWFGDDPALLARHANLADLSASKLDLWFAKSNVHVSWDDGWPLLAPVGSFAANRFGLHDMVGNVAEWCAGGLTVYPGNQGFLVVEGTRVHRGGSFRSDSVRARSTARYIEPETNRSTDIGVRPAASLVGVRRR